MGKAICNRRNFLAKESDDFGNLFDQNQPIDFQNQQFNWILNKKLLQKHFNLTIEAPIDSLCPTISNRYDYVCLIRELEILTRLTSPELLGDKVGTGYSCIYGLLCAKQFGYHMLCTDILQDVLDAASLNVEHNSLSLLMEMQLGTPDKIIDVKKETKYLFCLCNPPFYSSQEEYARAQDIKATTAQSKITGRPHEMVYSAGGSEEFIRRAIHESLIIGKRIVWYTFLVYQKETLHKLLKEFDLHSSIIKTIHVRPTQPGKTRRWILAWSFYTFELNTNHIRYIFMEHNINWSSKIQELLQEHVIEVKLLTTTRDLAILECLIDKNTWSRSYKRAKLSSPKQVLQSPLHIRLAIEDKYITIFTPTLTDHLLFNSFYQFLKNQLT